MVLRSAGFPVRRVDELADAAIHSNDPDIDTWTRP
jgi:hypothetical protein